MIVSSRTPEGVPNHCPVCGTALRIEPSQPLGDAPCPRCGHLLWFICNKLGVKTEQISRKTSFAEDLGVDSLDIVELVMEFEEEYGVTIPDDQAERIKTVGDAINILEQLIRDRGEGT
jgi:acyl carrier protein